MGGRRERGRRFACDSLEGIAEMGGRGCFPTKLSLAGGCDTPAGAPSIHGAEKGPQDLSGPWAANAATGCREKS